MKYILAAILHFFFLTCVFAQNTQSIITADIDNFWTAYDKIVTTKDNAEQLDYLNKLFIEKGNPGLKDIMQVRRYTPQEYVDAINNYHLFWQSIQENTFRAKDFAGEIESGIDKLRKLYPESKPAQIYFMIGVFRTGGTTLKNHVLIGSEMTLADQTTNVSELSESQSNFKNNHSGTTFDRIAFTNVHEFVHTQQKTTVCDTLLGQSVMEGVAEFLAVKAMGIPSFTPAIEFGRNKEQRVKSAFIAQMFSSNYSYWLYSNAKNEFDTRDLGYYIGYTIAEKYYEKAKDKKVAVKEMIELDYNNPMLLAKYVDKSEVLSKPVKEFDKDRPRVIALKPFKNGDHHVSLNVTQITVVFSKQMNDYYRNFKIGPLGEKAQLKFKKIIGFSEDGKSFSFEVEPLEPNKHYQLVIADGFRDTTQKFLKPYLIDFTTADK